MVKFPFLSKFGKGNQDQNKLGNILLTISLRLKDQQQKLDEAKRRLQERDKDLFDKVKRAHRENDKVKAAIYAQEIADIRNMIKVIYTGYLALEKVIIRLETAQTMQDVSAVLGPTAALLEGLKVKMRNVAPDVALALSSIIDTVSSIANSSGIQVRNSDLLSSYNEREANIIIEEAARSAEKDLKVELPDLPLPPQGIQPQVYQQPSQENRQRRTRDISEEDVIQYITTHGGFLDVEDFCKVYGAERDAVLAILNTMSREGKILLS